MFVELKGSTPVLVCLGCHYKIPQTGGLKQKTLIWGTSLAVQCLGLHASSAGDMGSVSGQGTKIPRAAQCNQKKKEDTDFLTVLEAASSRSGCQPGRAL